MAKAALINEATYRDGVNQVGDIVGIFDDTHQFSATELAMFDIVSVPNLTRAELVGALKSPDIRQAIDTGGVEITVWRNSEAEPWRELVTPMKYTWTTAGLTSEVGELLQSEAVDRDTKLDMLAMFGNNTSWQAANQTIVAVSEVID